jgi:hypothetical protein
MFHIVYIQDGDITVQGRMFLKEKWKGAWDAPLKPLDIKRMGLPHTLRHFKMSRRGCSKQGVLKAGGAQSRGCSKQGVLKAGGVQSRGCSKQVVFKARGVQSKGCSKQGVLKAGVGPPPSHPWCFQNELKYGKNILLEQTQLLILITLQLRYVME